MRLLLAVAGIVLAVDQATKTLVRELMRLDQSIPIFGDFLKLTYVKNTGAAFGMFSHGRPVFVVATILAICLILFYHMKTKETNVWFNIALGLELGGAVGNLIDRVARGWVTDFIHFKQFAVFNAADSAITVGVILLLVTLTIDMVREQKEESKGVSGIT
jgi:signal peptidase II